ncbi:RNase A-like domain-containing protein [Streptomyces sp. NPDC054797]
MYLHVKQKIVTFLTVLCLTVGAGGTAAAAEPPPDRDPTLLEIAARVAQYSKCRELPLLERPKCAKEFAIKSLKIGLGVGVYLYVFRESMEDGGASFAGLEKEVEELKKLKPLLVMDPHTKGDPKKQREVLEQFVKTYKAAKPNVDTLRTKLALAARATGPQADSVALLAGLTASTYFPAGTPQPEVVATGELGKWIADVLGALDQINAGFDQMNGALDEMNGVMVEVNESIDGINKGLDQANRGMTQLNAGVTQMNKGLELTNKAVAGFNKAAERILEVPDFKFDFSHVGDSVGANSMTPEERADRERRMGLLLDLLPGIGDGKGIFQAITGKDMASSEQLSGTDRALGALAVLRWLRVGGKLIPDDIRAARKADDVFACNSFPAGTRVLMANGSHKPIEDVQAGEMVLATEPGGDTELTQPRPVESVPFTSAYTDKTFVRLTITGEGGAQSSVTSTENHRYWLPERQSWAPAGTLRAGDHLRTPQGAQATVTATTQYAHRQDTYDLDVNGIDSYYVQVGTEDVLVHNCTDLARAEKMFQGVAHTLDEHVNVTPAQMKALAIKKTQKLGKPTPNSRWASQDLAQKAVNQLVDQNKARIEKFVRDAGKGGEQQLTLTGKYGTGSLGDSMDHLGNYSPTTSNGFKVTLAIKQGHKPGGFYVLTAYPL